jgi:hypothetical protein
MSYPAMLSYGISQINGVSANTFRIQAQTTNDVTGGGSIRFTLPTNALVDMRKVKLHFCASTSGTAGAGNAGSRLSEAHMLFNRVQVNAGGIPLSSGLSNLNVLQQALKVVHGHDADNVDGHLEIVRDLSPYDFRDLSAANVGSNEALTTKSNATWLSLSLGPLFDSIEPRLVSTDLLPEIQVELFLSNSNVICRPSAGSLAGFTTASSTLDGNFTISNYHLAVPCYSIADGVYESVLDRTIERDDYLALTYKEYYNFSDTFTGTTLFSNSSSCLNRIIAVFRNNGYDTQGAPVRIAGSAQGGTQGQNYFQHPDYNGELYVSKQARFTAPLATNITGSSDGLDTEGQINMSFRVNSVQMPNYPVPCTEWYPLTKDAMGVDKFAMCNSMVEYMEDRYIIAVRTCLPNDSVRVKSGLDTRSSSVQMRLNTDLTTNAKASGSESNVEIFLDTTAELRVGAGRMLQVIA